MVEGEELTPQSHPVTFTSHAIAHKTTYTHHTYIQHNKCILKVFKQYTKL